jgi:hypothetical protein
MIVARRRVAVELHPARRHARCQQRGSHAGRAGREATSQLGEVLLECASSAPHSAPLRRCLEDVRQRIAEDVPDRFQWRPRLRLAQGDNVILTENETNDRNITVQIAKEWQPMTVNDSQWQCRMTVASWATSASSSERGLSTSDTGSDSAEEERCAGRGRVSRQEAGNGAADVVKRGSGGGGRAGGAADLDDGRAQAEVSVLHAAEEPPERRGRRSRAGRTGRSRSSPARRRSTARPLSAHWVAPWPAR